jgi:predicted nucleotidyltransferase
MSLLKLLPCPLSSTELHDLLREIVAKLCHAEPEVKIILFGSMATDHQNAESDIDLAVIIPDSVKVKDYLNLLKPQRPLSHWPIDLLIFNEQQFLEKSLIGGVCFEIANEGFELYPKWTFNL